MELATEDSLRMHVLLTQQLQAIRIDESKMIVYGLSERGEAKVLLNPNCRDEQYTKIVKEFIQQNAIPADIATEALRLLNDKKYYDLMKHELSLIRQQLGGGNGSKNVAQLAFDMMHSKTVKY